MPGTRLESRNGSCWPSKSGEPATNPARFLSAARRDWPDRHRLSILPITRVHVIENSLDIASGATLGYCGTRLQPAADFSPLPAGSAYIQRRRAEALRRLKACPTGLDIRASLHVAYQPESNHEKGRVLRNASVGVRSEFEGVF